MWFIDYISQKLWEDVKKRFFGTIRKRKLSNSEAESVAESECSESSAKRRNFLTYSVSPSVERPSGTPSSSVSSPREHNEASRRSAFRPWSPLEEKHRVEASSNNSQTLTTSSPSHSLFIQPSSHAMQSSSHSIQTASHPIQPAYISRNCACPPAPYSAMNGYVTHSTPIKSEYSSVICSQAVISHSPKSRSESPSNETAVIQDFASPERVKQVLSKYCQRGHLPSVDELSFALAKELQEWSYGQSRVLNELKEKGEKLREEMNTLRRENTTKLDSACEELKCCQEKLDQLNRYEKFNSIIYIITYDIQGSSKLISIRDQLSLVKPILPYNFYFTDWIIPSLINNPVVQKCNPGYLVAIREETKLN